MATSLVDASGRITYPAGTTGLQQFTFVALNGSGQLVYPTTNGIAVGILDDTPQLTAGVLNTTSGEYASGYTVGFPYGVVFRGAQKVYAAATLAANTLVATNALGQAVSAAGSGTYIIGMTMASAASGDLVMVSVSGTPSTVAVTAVGTSRTIAAATTITSADSIIVADATGAAFTQPLPAMFAGSLTVDAVTSNTNLVTLTPNGSDTIEGNATLTLGDQSSGAPYQSVQLARVGTTWRII